MYFGIDIGGTSLKYGIIDDKFNIVEKATVPTEKSSEKALLDQLCAIALSAKQKYDIKYIGIGSPGFVSNETGVIAGSGNTPFKNSCVAPYITKKTGLPVILGNDANCAAYGEYLAGTKSVENSIMITLGTGIGGGIIIDKKPYTGKNGLAGEIGHMVIAHNGLPCVCGKKGCYEQYASATALVRMTKKAVTDGLGMLGAELNGKTDSVDGRTVFDYIAKGCTAADAILDTYSEYLVTGIENLIDIFQPEEIILAGGITNEKDRLMSYVSRHFSGRCGLRIAQLKNDAGFIGAALLGYNK